MNTKKLIGLALVAMLFALCHPVEAQQPKKVPRIGYLTAASASAMVPRSDAFRQGLRELGYIEGKNIIIEYRFGDGKLDRLPAPAAALLRRNVDIKVTAGPAATPPAKETT